MAKKGAKKTKRTAIKTKTTSTPKQSRDTNKILIENFVNLQKVMTNLAVKFETLSDNITKLLQLFEISAKSFAEKVEKGEITSTHTDKEFLEKIDKLLDQNKTIAKGLTLMEGKLRERVYGSAMEKPSQVRPSRYPPQF